MNTGSVALKVGLAKFGSDFAATLCTVCDGEGKYEQTYTAGCGMGSYQSIGKCDWCDGHGLRMGDKPAPYSVVNMVLLAGAKNDR
jgi:hypothetical protein